VFHENFSLIVFCFHLFAFVFARLAFAFLRLRLLVIVVFCLLRRSGGKTGGEKLRRGGFWRTTTSSSGSCPVANYLNAGIYLPTRRMWANSQGNIRNAWVGVAKADFWQHKSLSHLCNMHNGPRFSGVSLSGVGIRGNPAPTGRRTAKYLPEMEP